MTSFPARRSAPLARPRVAPQTLARWRRIVLLSLTIFFALSAYYFVGVDEGAVSVTGNGMVVHEWVHDARHFLGFPCH